MPSTYTTRNGIELIATGEQSGSWGDTTNTNLQIIDRALSGVGTIDLSGSAAAHTLTTTDGTLTDGMYRLLVLDGATEACTITVAAVSDFTANLAMSSVNISGGAISGITDLAVADGGTGASTVSAAQTNLQVDPAGTAVALAIALG